MKVIMSAVTWDKFLRAGMRQQELIPLAVKHGCIGVEFQPYWLDVTSELPRLREQLVKYSLVCTYACNEGLLAENEVLAQQALAALEESIAVAHELGAFVLRVKVAVGSCEPAVIDTAWWQQAMKQLVNTAADKGVVLAIENAADAVKGDSKLLLKLITTVASPWLKLTYNTGNWLAAGQDAKQAAVLFKDHLGYVRLNDIAFQNGIFIASQLGTGAVDAAGLARLIAANGFDGLYAIEVPGGEHPDLCVAESMKYLLSK